MCRGLDCTFAKGEWERGVGECREGCAMIVHACTRVKCTGEGCMLCQ